MFAVGARVVCANDNFPPSIIEWCDEIPVIGRTYTIRAISPGVCLVNGTYGPSFKFEDLNNHDNATGRETGFADWRFNLRDEYSDIFDDEPEDSLRVELRHPGFLVWLSRFLGQWRTGSKLATVRRREDGWLTAGTTPLQHALSEESYLLRCPDGPLGPSPDPVAQRDGLNADAGHDQGLSVKALHQQLQELPQLHRHKRWVRYWDACAPRCPISHRDLLAHKDLYEVYCLLKDEG